MANLPATGAAVVVVLLFGVALLALAQGTHAAAGLSFLAASLVIYFRETRLVGP